ncbi:MAG: transglutaminase domain-containing protein [Candidatus Limnocylindrales bacterium]
MNRSVGYRPQEGWSSIILVAVLCGSLAVSLDDAQLVLGRPELTDMLLWTAIGGALAGLIGPKVGWGRWTTLAIGATAAALLTSLLVGSVLLPEGGTPGSLFRATAVSTSAAWYDLVILDRLSTPQYGHHLLVLGLFVWGSSMFASYAAFGHRRPVAGVVLIGALLVVNMSLTVRDQLPYLVAYSLAALFLLIRFHIVDERSDWLRRRIGDPSAMSGLYLRGGSVFIGLAVIGSLVLTNVAASDPLAGVWTDTSVRFVEWARVIDRFLPKGGQGVAFAPTFGASASISGSWFTNDDLALTIEIPAGETDLPYWRAVTYDTLVLDGYTRGDDVAAIARPAGAPLLADTGDAVATTGRREVAFTIVPATGGDTLFAPQTPVSMNIPSELTTVGQDGFFTAIGRNGGRGAYTVTSLVPLQGDRTEAGLTQNRLRVAGQDYPAEIAERYASPPAEGILGPAAHAILDEIVGSDDANPYDLASAIQAFLKSDANFTYDANILEDGIDCAGLSKVECFAVHRRGYCQFYAATMTAFLREEGIPARVAEGFLPGRRDSARGVSEVRNSDAHAWVEVYFPAYGWVDFDPTGGGVAQLGGLPVGRPEESPRSTPSDSGGRASPPADPRNRERDGPAGIGGGGLTSNGPSGPLVAVSLLLAAVVSGLALIAWQRGPRGPVTADRAYGSMTRLAGRFGFGPRPSQTVYEYAGALAERLPGARPELETVARAKVEVAYGGLVLGHDRLIGLRAAERRLRFSLLRLALGRRSHRSHGSRRT